LGRRFFGNVRRTAHVSERLVLDTSAILAYLEDEQGADQGH